MVVENLISIETSIEYTEALQDPTSSEYIQAFSQIVNSVRKVLNINANKNKAKILVGKLCSGRVPKRRKISQNF